MDSDILDSYFMDYVEKNKVGKLQTKKKEYLVFEERTTSYVYVVNKGILKMSTFLSGGNEFNIKFVTAGNLITLLEDEISPVVKMPFTVRTLSQHAEIFLLDRFQFWEDIKNDMLLNEYVRNYYRKNLNFQIRKTCALASNGKFGAVCAQLYELQNLFGKDIPRGRLIDLSISNEELTKFCGINNASSFNRILRKLKEMGVLETTPKKIVIKDCQLLKDLLG
ncbi:Crp/Fnr family transcriptional regulator [Enterococcus gilvus]|uniref:Crp/Fnr family transcriptional regulator n=1 Tax=Enterococcus gilvus TaxID=160453 RepID=UPI003EDA0589